MLSKVLRVAREEVLYFNVRLVLASLLALPLPYRVGHRIRPFLLRLVGVRIGHGTMMAGMPRILAGGNFHELLDIGQSCWFNVGCTLDIHAAITIEDNVRLGQEVMILTHTHEIGPADWRAGSLEAKPVRIGKGAWLGARSVVLPGVDIGEGAIVAAGAVVSSDVLPHTAVGGVPARVLKDLPEHQEGS